MKTLISLLGVLLITLSFQCNKNNDVTETGCYKGELLDIPNCGAPVIKILQGDLTKLDYEPTWTHPTTGQVYTNVFVVKNHCSFGENGFAAGEGFYFRVLTSANDLNCNICMAVFPVPSKSNFIMIVPAGLCDTQ